MLKFVNQLLNINFLTIHMKVFVHKVAAKWNMSIFNNFNQNVFTGVYQKYCSSVGGTSLNVVDTILP